ncbi:MAG: Na+/H+ antiporter subunit E [Deltaproteobacteria bacterium]|nr:Na+/H+ antiporter subunit E [Deltaproteobacteria bacterium]
MEITLLVQATDECFSVIEKARRHAIDVLNTATLLTSETRSVEERKLQALLKGAVQARASSQQFLSTFLILMAFWCLLSGKFDIFHLSLGCICSLVIAYLSHDLLFANVRVGDARLIIQRFIAYMPWHLYQIAISNVHVAKLVLSPRMPIEPNVFRFKTKLESDMSWMALATSITLTPGTITIDIEDSGEFVVHALDKKLAADLNAGEMEDKIAHIFMESDHIYIQDALDMARVFGAMK